MNTKSRNLLLRWQSLENDNRLQRAKFTIRVLGVSGLVLFIFVVLGVVFKLHPAVVAVAAAVMGWAVAARHALRTRVIQWPAVKRYVDWKRVQEDLRLDHTEP
jgi:Na+/H+ antiporter NhaD/arsenite permease-like protein